MAARPTALSAAAARKRRLPAATTVVQYALLCLLILLALYPIFLMVSMSLRPSTLIYADFFGLPIPPIFTNYRAALVDLIPSLLRTLFVTLASIALIAVFAAPAAYAFARMRFLLRDQLFYVVLAIMMIPGVIMLVPRFIQADQLGLRGSLEGLVVFYVAGGQPFAIFLLTTFFRSQSEEIFEAARVDGAGELRALLAIALPLARPILVTIAIMNFLHIYDDFVWPSLMLPKSVQTLLLALEKYNPQVEEMVNRPDLGAQTAGFVFATVPQLLLFAFGMKYFIQGLTSGSVKA
jgi:multiple sugar transport system permease protein/raffinose/stachyose/melibiose transport system permease protein